MALRSATHSALLVLLIIQLLFVRTERPRVLLIIQLLFVRTERPRVLLIIQLLLKALTTPLVLRAPDHPAAVCTRPTIISYRVCMCVCMRVSTRLYLPTTTTEYVCVCVYVCMASRIYSVCIYSVHVYLLCMRVSTPSTQNPDERARSDRAHATPGRVGAA